MSKVLKLSLVNRFAICLHVEKIPYSRKYWRELYNYLAVEPKIAIARILNFVDLNLRFGTVSPS